MFYERVLDLVKNVNYQGDYKKSVVLPLIEEFNISERTVYKRVKSLFGCTITKLAQEQRTPTKEAVENAVLLSKNKGEAREILGLKESDVVWKSIFDKTFGVSTFTAAKTKLILKQPNKDYFATVDDNLSIISAQAIGDGSLDRLRKSIRISHSVQQLDYLKMKVSLFNKAFPQSSGIENIKLRQHTQGHKYVDWYSRKLPLKYIEKIIDKKKHELVENLTPLGVFLLYFDDGSLSINDKYGTYSLSFAYSEHYPELGLAFQKHLKSFGYDFNVKQNGVYISSKPVIASFIKNMILPFKCYIPECMEYKIDMKI